jgi:asparagine N-glycosylation enzyme membrane subunit Stt3
MVLFWLALIINYYYPIIVIQNNLLARLFFVGVFVALVFINYILFKYYARFYQLPCSQCHYVTGSVKTVKKQIKQEQCIRCGHKRISKPVNCCSIEGHHPLKSFQHSILMQVLMIILLMATIGLLSVEFDYLRPLLWLFWLLLVFIAWLMQNKYLLYKARKLGVNCQSCGFYPKDMMECRLMLCEEIDCCEKPSWPMNQKK